MYSSDPNSKTSKRRKSRGFVSLKLSCRIHRRAEKRSLQKRTIGTELLDPGEKREPPLRGGRLKSFMYTAGGSIKYH
jgi:hypothetical protein